MEVKNYKKINVLGTPCTVTEDDLNSPILANADGICKLIDKEIILRKQEYLCGDTEQGKQYRMEHVIRHELIHAFAEESGIIDTINEQITDWMAAMIPKINAAFDHIIE